MTWFLWIALAILGTSSEQVINRKILSKSTGYWEYLLGYSVGALITTGLLFDRGTVAINTESLLWLSVAGVLWFLTCVFTFKADQNADVTDTAVLLQLQVIFAIIGGVLLFGETLTVFKILGGILVVAGTSINGTSMRLKSNKGLWFKLIAVVFFSTALLVDKHLTSLVDPRIIPVVGFIFPLIIAATAMPRRLLNGWRLSKEMRFINVGMGGLAGLSYFALVQAMAQAEISTVIPVYQLNLLVSLCLAHVLLKERGQLAIKFLAFAVITLGSVLIVW